MVKPTLCLDFDGVCHSYTSGWQGAATIPDAPVEGLWDFLLAASVHFTIAIYSSRSHQEGGREAMVNWFDKHAPYLGPMSKHAGGIRWWDDTFGGGISLQFPLEKPSAFVTLDDRALTFTGLWPDVEDLRAFTPWNKR